MDIEDKQNRTHQVTIRLEPKIYEALTEIGNRVGIKPASIAGFAIGDFVTRTQASYGAANLMAELVAKEMTALTFEQTKSLLTEEQMKSFVLESLKN